MITVRGVSQSMVVKVSSLAPSPGSTSRCSLVSRPKATVTSASGAEVRDRVRLSVRPHSLVVRVVGRAPRLISLPANSIARSISGGVLTSGLVVPHSVTLEPQALTQVEPITASVCSQALSRPMKVPVSGAAELSVQPH